MIRFAVFNDPHISDGPPLGRKGDYGSQIISKLQGIALAANEVGCVAAVCTGDVFHRKRPNHVSHGLVNTLMTLFRDDFKMPVLVTPGNHDMTEAGMDTLHRQPLGVLERAGAVILLRGDPPNQPLLVESQGIKVGFVGRPYSTDGDLDPAYYRLSEAEAAVLGATTLSVMVAHASLVPPGRQPVYPHLQADSIKFGGPLDLLLCGHLHEKFGLHDLARGTIYLNPGSISRVARNKDSQRKRQFVIVSVDHAGKLEFEWNEVPNQLPASEVFLQADVPTDDPLLAEFAERLGRGIAVEEQSIDEVIAGLGRKIPRAVRERLKQYLEEADHA